ncbi:MAG: divalent-cation tolerance protein CutA [Alphaproteobacteria bacterium]|nr:divalent-cation tolerance protein CutA [Alphaproteobacteria bacterium]
MNLCTVYMTVGSLAEAKSIAADLVGARLASGVNLIDGCHSIYRWQGEIRNRDEVVLLARTRRDLVDALVDRATVRHSYQCPCIIALPIENGHTDYLAWVEAETRPPGESD